MLVCGFSPPWPTRSLCWHLVGNRIQEDWAISRLRGDWKRLMQLEQRCSTSVQVTGLRANLICCDYKAVRLMYCAFDRDNSRSSSAQVCRFLRAMLDVLLDNKVIEYSHNDIPKDAKKRGTKFKRWCGALRVNSWARGCLRSVESNTHQR